MMNLISDCLSYKNIKYEIKEEFIMKIQNVLKYCLLDYSFCLNFENIESFTNLVITNVSLYKSRGLEL